MPLLQDPSKKYRPFPSVHLPNRQWPSKSIQKHPRWLSTDIRDGNQSLVDPMDSDQKWTFFEKLVELGYKEIEVSFPSASDTDYNFVRRLVETPGAVPDDVWIQVLTPCRPELIRRTVGSLKGLKKAIVHLYIATSLQEVVFSMNNQQTKALAVECTNLVRSLTRNNLALAGTEWAFEFSPETFSDYNLDFVLEVCEAVKVAWEPSVYYPIIFNLPATVEMGPPNIYADQIEYFCTNISEREKICVSVHPHNDRGCAVAAAELAQMAGADRVEGTLFGNGERTGNVDLVTLALNLYRQGIHPGIDLSEIDEVVKLVERSTKIPVHPRAPYGGQLVFSAFSVSHQDAIKKGFAARESSGAEHEGPWKVPHLPLDPSDIGRTYEDIIRVNSRSGKGGAAWIILRNLHLDLPPGLQKAFSEVVQKEADRLSRELKRTEIIGLFEDTYYLRSTPRIELIDYDVPSRFPLWSAHVTNPLRLFNYLVVVDGKDRHLTGGGKGPVEALVSALSLSLKISLAAIKYKASAIGQGTDVKAVAYIECTANGNDQRKVWGVGIHEDVARAAFFAVLNAASSVID